jgi:hypothetical protein
MILLHQGYRLTCNANLPSQADNPEYFTMRKIIVSASIIVRCTETNDFAQVVHAIFFETMLKGLCASIIITEKTLLAVK